MPKILVVDDEAIITMQLEERLSIMGYTVVGMAASGEDAVEKARRLRPDLVLMDIVMPGTMNGIEAAKIIKKELDIPGLIDRIFTGGSHAGNGISHCGETFFQLHRDDRFIINNKYF